MSSQRILDLINDDAVNKARRGKASKGGGGGGGNSSSSSSSSSSSLEPPVAAGAAAKKGAGAVKRKNTAASSSSSSQVAAPKVIMERAALNMWLTMLSQDTSNIITRISDAEEVFSTASISASSLSSGSPAKKGTKKQQAAAAAAAAAAAGKNKQTTVVSKATHLNPMTEFQVNVALIAKHLRERMMVAILTERYDDGDNPATRGVCARIYQVTKILKKRETEEKTKSKVY